MFGLLYTHRLVFQGCREVGGGFSSFAFAPEQPFEAGQHGAGATSFVSSTASLLREAGVSGGNIREDKYLGYHPRPRTETTAATHGLAPAND